MSGSVTLAIPASDEVQVNPSVLSGGGSALDLNGLILTTNWRIPLGTVQSYPSQTSVAGWFGGASQEAALAQTYFLGFDNSTKKPGALLYTQYNQSSVGAWVLGGSVTAEGTTLTQLQALSGTIVITIDGTPYTSSPIDLSSATSFSNAAELMTIGLGLVGFTAGQFTGTISGTTLSVSAVSSGSISVGQEIRGNGAAAGTVVSALGTGTGGAGTYTVTISQTVSSGAMTSVIPTIQYDSVSGGFLIVSPTRGTGSTITYATGTLGIPLNLTLASGGLISQGAAPAIPSVFMANVTVQTQDWASFMTSFDPDNGSGNTTKLAFSKWVNGTVDRYEYIAWDTDVTPTLSTSATTSLGYLVNIANSYDGTSPIYSPTDGANKAAFQMGAIASVDFSATNGRATMKFRSQSGLAPDVMNQQVSTNLQANGYNFYGVWGTANQLFRYFSPGQVSGKFKWTDSYINQIWLNNQLQLAALSVLTQVKHIPYNAGGREIIRAGFKDPINQAVNFGAIVAGVSLSSAQAAEVNAAAGLAIDTTLTTQGWYLQVLDATTQVRQARGSPPCNLWYMDGESVQKISLASILIQ